MSDTCPRPVGGGTHVTVCTVLPMCYLQMHSIRLRAHKHLYLRKVFGFPAF